MSAQDDLPDLWQDTIAEWKHHKQAFCVYLINGIKLQFTEVLEHDDRCFTARDASNKTQLVTFHSISTMLPGTSVPDSGHHRPRRGT